jgi:hypothetical protein
MVKNNKTQRQMLMELHDKTLKNTAKLERIFEIFKPEGKFDKMCVKITKNEDRSKNNRKMLLSIIGYIMALITPVVGYVILKK